MLAEANNLSCELKYESTKHSSIHEYFGIRIRPIPYFGTGE
jgi:hypothetical protein